SRPSTAWAAIILYTVPAMPLTPCWPPQVITSISCLGGWSSCCLDSWRLRTQRPPFNRSENRKLHGRLSTIRHQVCASPVRSRAAWRGYPFEVAMPNDGPVRGVVLADQARSLSWEKRYVQRIDQAPATLVADVRERIGALLDIG